MLYLLIVEYSNDAERKRLEYVLSSYRSRLKARRPSGSIVIIEAEPGVMASLLEDLYSKLPREEVKVYGLHDPGVDPKPRTSVIEVSSSLSPLELVGAIGLVMAEAGASMARSNGESRVYTASSRSGRVVVSFTVSGSGGGSRARIRVAGYGRLVWRIRSMLVDRLSLIGSLEERVVGD